MNTMKHLARVAAAAVLAVGISAGTAASADAAPKNPRPGDSGGGAVVLLVDTGWG